MLYPVKYLRSLQRTSNKKEPRLTALHIPEIVLLILGHLDPPTILLIRLVSSSINTLILTHQRSISISVAQRQFSGINIDCHPPNIDSLQEFFYLKTIARLPKAYELASRSNSQFDCHVETSGETVKGRETIIIRPTLIYPTFLARCARAILTIWVIGDIRRHITRPEPLPAYIPLLGRREKCVRLFSRMTFGVSEIIYGSRIVPRVPWATIAYTTSACSSEANRQAISQYIETLAPKSPTEIQSNLAIFDAARTIYLHSLPLDRRLDLVWVQNYLFAGLANKRCRMFRSSDEEVAFALQQSPKFLLSWRSRDQNEWRWALRLILEMTRHEKSEYSIAEWARIIPFPPVENDMIEEADRVKGELTRGDWRHGNSAAWRAS